MFHVPVELPPPLPSPASFSAFFPSGINPLKVGLPTIPPALRNASFAFFPPPFSCERRQAAGFQIPRALFRRARPSPLGEAFNPGPDVPGLVQALAPAFVPARPVLNPPLAWNLHIFRLKISFPLRFFVGFREVINLAISLLLSPPPLGMCPSFFSRSGTLFISREDFPTRPCSRYGCREARGPSILFMRLLSLDPAFRFSAGNSLAANAF